MEYLLNKVPGLDNIGINEDNSSKPLMTMITPCNPEERGAQLSLSFSFNVTEFYVELQKRGVVVSSSSASISFPP